MVSLISIIIPLSRYNRKSLVPSNIFLNLFSDSINFLSVFFSRVISLIIPTEPAIFPFFPFKTDIEISTSSKPLSLVIIFVSNLCRIPFCLIFSFLIFFHSSGGYSVSTGHKNKSFSSMFKSSSVYLFHEMILSFSSANVIAIV